MERKIMIDCEQVYDTGSRYSQDAQDIESNQTEMTEIADSIESFWKGGDSYNFLLSLRKHADDLNDLIGFLDHKSEVLKGAAGDHKTSDDNFCLKMKRSDEDYE